MFAPDGRNSVQTIGHGVVSAAKVIITIFGVIAIAPTLLFFIARFKLQVQEATIIALNEPGPKAALLVDFNEATLGAFDGRISRAWLDAGGSGFDPSTRSLPFKAQMLYRQGNQWTPAETDLNPAWIYYNLPFEAEMVDDERFHHGNTANVWDHRKERVEGIEVLAPFITEYGQGRFTSRVYSDPWWAVGAFKMAPTKNWDWNSGFELVHAKASYNYRAYVAAVRAVSRMRQLAACSATGVPVDTSWHSGTIPSRLVASAGAKGDDYARAYRTAFSGQLPVVLLQLQDLTVKSIEHDDNWIRFKAEFRTDLTDRSDVAMLAPTTTPFITGMHLWSGYHPYSSSEGRPVFTYSDFFINTTPSLSPEAKEAQRTLLRLLDDRFWFRLFPKEVRPQVHALLEAERITLDKDTHFARMLGHHAYYSRDAQ